MAVKKINAKAIKDGLKANGWVEDRWGHLKKNDRRVKFQKTSIRYEKSYLSGDDKTTEWLKISSDYIKNIVIDDDNKIYIKDVEIV